MWPFSTKEKPIMPLTEGSTKGGMCPKFYSTELPIPRPKTPPPPMKSPKHVTKLSDKL